MIIIYESYTKWSLEMNQQSIQHAGIQLSLTAGPQQNEMRVAFAQLRDCIAAIPEEEWRVRERHWRELSGDTRR